MNSIRETNENYNEGIKKNTFNAKKLTSIYKKNGSFDKQRNIFLETFKNSDVYSKSIIKLEEIIEKIIKENPDFLLKNKGKIAALIQGQIINDYLKLKSDTNNLVPNKELNNDSNTNFLFEIDQEIEKIIFSSTEFQVSLRKDLMKIQDDLMKTQDNFMENV